MGVLRTIWMWVYFCSYLLYTGIFLIKVKILNSLGKKEEAMELTNQVTKAWSRRFMKAVGVDVKVKGLENVPDEPVLVVSNHQSMFDITALTGHLNKGLAFVAKHSLRYIPIMGAWMKVMKCIFIDRSDVRQALRAFRKADETFAAGQSLVIFPEGTRSQEPGLQPFRKGSFKIALREGVPILPVTINGSDDIWEGNDYLMQPGEVEVVVSEPIYLDELTEEEKENVSQKVRERIAENLE